MNRFLKIGLVAMLFTVAFASCVPQKKMLYLKEAQMAAENISKEYVNDRTIDYKSTPSTNIVPQHLREKMEQELTCRQMLAFIFSLILWTKKVV